MHDSSYQSEKRANLCQVPSENSLYLALLRAAPVHNGKNTLDFPNFLNSAQLWTLASFKLNVNIITYKAINNSLRTKRTILRFLNKAVIQYRIFLWRCGSIETAWGRKIGLVFCVLTHLHESRQKMQNVLFIFILSTV